MFLAWLCGWAIVPVVAMAQSSDTNTNRGSRGRDGSSSTTVGSEGAPGPSGLPGQVITPRPPETPQAPSRPNAGSDVRDTPAPTPTTTVRPVSTDWSVDVEPQRTSGISTGTASLAGAGLLASAGLVVLAVRRSKV